MTKTRSIQLRFLFVLGLFFFLPLVQAKTFKNAYISFELPQNWNCKLENTDWVCRVDNEKEFKEAIIVFTAKETGPTDTIDQYVSHLGTPQPTAFKGSQGSVSKVIYQPQKSPINNQMWIDGLHMSSEVNNYYTRYLATIKDRIAILITFSAHKDFYTKYNSDFFKSVSSLQVIATKNLFDGGAIGGTRSGSEQLGPPIASGAFSDLDPSLTAPEARTGSGSGGKLKFLFLGIAFLLAAVGGYVYWKSSN